MKSIRILLVLSTIGFLPIKAQIIDGTYTCHNQKIKIDGSQIEYELISMGFGINTIYKGNGIIEVKNRRLFIKPDNIHLSNNSIIEQIKAFKKDTMFISIHGNEPNQIVISFYKKNKEIYTTISGTDKIGKAPRNKIIDCDSVFVVIIGYKPVGQKTNFRDEFDYEVELYPYNEDDFHSEFVTNNGKGFKMKLSANKLHLKYEIKGKQKWNRYIRIN
jgi:hypothetical protein